MVSRQALGLDRWISVIEKIDFLDSEDDRNGMAPNGRSFATVVSG